MKNTNIKNALIGVAIALVAAYSFPAVLLTLMMGPRGLLILFSFEPLQAMVYVSWIVIPLGAALGMLIPRMAAGKRRWVAALHGAGYGAVGGLAAMICFIYVFSLMRGGDVLAVAAMVYSAVWVGAYAFIRAKAPVRYR
jgi:hypothetical protein